MTPKWRVEERVTLLAAENIIDVDAAGVEGTVEDVELIISMVERIARSLPNKPFVMTNWNGTSLTAAGVERYKERMTTLVPAIRAVVRYGMTESVSRVIVKTTAAKVGGGPSAASNIFATKEDALAAIRQGRVG